MSMHRFTPRTKKIVIVAVSVTVLCVGIVTLPNLALRPVLTRIIRTNGFPDARVSDVTIMPQGLLIDHISLDGDDFSTVDGINIECNWMDVILHRRIQSLHVKNITLAADLDDSGHYKISGWNAELPQSNNTTTLFPIANIVLQGVVLDITTSKGDIRIEGKLALDTPTPDKQTLQYAVWAQQKQLSFDITGSTQINTTGSWKNDITVNDARIDIAPYEISRLSGYIETSGDKSATTTIHKGHAVAGRINAYDTLWQNIDLNWDSSKNQAMAFSFSPSGHSDVTLEGHWITQPQHTIDITLSSPDLQTILALIPQSSTIDLSQTKPWTKNIAPLQVHLSTTLDKILSDHKSIDIGATIGKKDKSVSLNGTLETDKDANAITINIPSTTMSAKKIGNLLPLKEKWDTDISGGDMTAEASLTIPLADNPSPLKSTAKIAIKNLQAVWKKYAFQETNGSISLSSLSPIQFDGEQKIDFLIGEKSIGKGQLVFMQGHKNNIQIKTLTATIANGEISATPFALPIGENSKTESSTTLSLKNFDIATLVPLLDMNGLSGQGAISGTIPLRFSSNGIELTAAHIESTDGGVFSFAPETYPTSLQGDDSRMQTVREALKDFHFSTLSIAMSGPANGKMTTLLKTEGTNPVFGTRPIHLNLNLEGDIAGVIRKLAGETSWTAGDIQGKLRSQ